jgi:hypothetical protein
MRHLEMLDERFGRPRVLGGQCVIAATLNEKREIVHLNKSHSLSFGERDGAMSGRVKAIGNLMAGAQFDAQASATILLDMWEKWVFLAALAWQYVPDARGYWRYLGGAGRHGSGAPLLSEARINRGDGLIAHHIRGRSIGGKPKSCAPTAAGIAIKSVAAETNPEYLQSRPESSG